MMCRSLGLVILAALCACHNDDATEEESTTAFCAAYPAPTITATSTVAGPDIDPGTCQTSVQTSALPANQVQHLGTHTVGNTVSFTIPANTAGFSIVLQAVSASMNDVTFNFSGQRATVPNAVAPLYVRDPDDSLFYDNSVLPNDPPSARAYMTTVALVTGTLSAPNTTATVNSWSTNGAPTGTWTLTVSDWAYECALCADEDDCTCEAGGDTTGTYDVTVLTRLGAPLADAGGIDLRFYLVSDRFTATTALANAGMLRMVSTVRSIYNNAGLCLGNVTFVDVPAWAKSKYATGIDASATGPCDNLSQLFSLSQPGRALNLFLVDDIYYESSGSADATLVGLDGSIPAPSTISGTVNSGAVVNISDVGLGSCGGSISYTQCGSDLVAYIVAHEGGHWLGLYHTTESTGADFDPLSDTSKCVCSSCAPQSARSSCDLGSSDAYQVTGSDCNKGGSCDGGKNLMFWLVSDVSKATVTSQQGQVMRANPAVY